MADIKIKIIYRDGTEEKQYIDSYEVQNECLCIYIRFGKNSGTRHIPLDLIKEFTTS